MTTDTDKFLAEALDRLLQRPQRNVTTGAASPGLRAQALPQAQPQPQPQAPRPTAASVERNRMMAEMLSQGVPPPQTQPGQIPSTDAAIISALANIGMKVWGARKQRKADQESELLAEMTNAEYRQLLARELAMTRGEDPFSSELQPIVPPSLRGVRPMEGPGAAEAHQAQQDGLGSFVNAAQDTLAAEAAARDEHDMAALTASGHDSAPLTSYLAHRRLFPEQGDGFTLGPGQVRHDAQGNVIAENPHLSGPGGDPAGYREFDLMTQGMTPEDREAARRIALGLEGRAATGGYQFDSIRGADGIERPARRNPRDGVLEIFDGQRWMPAGMADAAPPVDSPETQQPSMSTADPSLFQSRTPEEQAALTEGATLSVRSQAELEREAPAAFRSVEYSARQMTEFANQARRLRDHPGLHSATGFGGSLRSRVPGTEAANAKAELDNLKNRAFISALGAMRESSKTGGAVGSVSEAEGMRFENAYVALDQSQTYEQFVENLDRLIEIAEGSAQRTRDAYSQEFSGITGAPMFELPLNEALGRAIDQQQLNALPPGWSVTVE